MKNGIDFKQFNKYIEKNYGKRCKEKIMGCITCQAWDFYDDLALMIAFAEDCENAENTQKPH